MKNVRERAPKKLSETKIFVHGRLSFCHLDKPWSGAEGNEPKYSVSLIIPKGHTQTIAAIENAIESAVKEGTTKKWEGKRPNVKSSNFKYPLKDGDVERPNDEAYKGCMCITCSSDRPVKVYRVIGGVETEVDPTEAYSGCWGYVMIGCFPFNKGSKGVSAGLDGVVKTVDDERLGGAVGMSVKDLAGLELDSDDEDGDPDDLFDN